MKETDQEGVEEAIASGRVVICYFFTTWCPHCKEHRPTLEKLAIKYAEQAVFLALDCDEAAAFVLGLKVETVPKVLGFKSGVKTELNLTDPTLPPIHEEIATFLAA